MIVSDEFLTERDTEAFLKFDSCFSAEFERQNTRTSPNLLNDTPNKTYRYTESK